MWAKTKRTPGFTIVELLIVTVVIGILAAITIVAYSGIQDRARFSKEQSDLSSIHKAIQMYYVDNGRYPVTNAANDWFGWDQVSGNSFIPGLSPKYMATIPQMDLSLPAGDTYLYASTGTNGTGYTLQRYRSTGLPTIETINNSRIKPTDSSAWGYWTSDVASNATD